MNFKEKVQSMTGKEIVMAMVNGLKKQHVEVDMGSYGEIKNGICVGCAATNFICETSGFIPSHKRHFRGSINFGISPSFLDCDYETIDHIESAIDCLRIGNIETYNRYAQMIGMTLLPENEELPHLSDHNWQRDLHHYEKWAETL